MARNRTTLLQIVQRVLDAMNQNSVNSISDGNLANKIAREAKQVYYDLMDQDDWPHLLDARQLESVSDTDRPNFLKIPEEVVRIDQVRYEVTQDTDTSRYFDVIKYLSADDFLDKVHQPRSDESNVDVVENFNSVPMFIRNDTRPYYWTTFDEEYIVFDAYDSDVDTTMQGSKSIVHCKAIPEWTHSDSFIPDMPDQMFTAYMAEVTAAAFTYWKQGASPKDEARAARGRSRLRKDAEKINAREHKADYGRRRPYITTSADGVNGSIRASLPR